MAIAVAVRADPEPCVTAADHGFLEALQFLHELGCTWNVGVCNAAAQRGDMAILTYAHEHGCPWSAETCRAAGDPGPYDATIHYDECKRASSLTVLQYLHKEGCPWHPDALLYASREVIAYAACHATGPQPDVAVSAAPPRPHEHTTTVGPPCACAAGLTEDPAMYVCMPPPSGRRWARANGLPGRLSREDVEGGGYAYGTPPMGIAGVMNPHAHHHQYHAHYEDHEMPPADAFAHGPPPHHVGGIIMPGPAPGMLPPGMNPMQWLMAGPPPWG